MIKILLQIASFKYVRISSHLLVLALVFGALSCSRINNSGEAKRGAQNPEAGTAAINQPSKKVKKVLTDMPFEELINATSGLLDDYWRQSFKDMGWQQAYNTPKGLIPYSEPIPSACGPTAMNNAFFCSGDQKIYFDDILMHKLYQDPGDYAAVTVLAHEWGHSIQNDLGILGDKKYFTIQTELQADCFAGAFAKHILELGYLEEGDLNEGGEALLKFGDPRNGKWFDPQAHGQSFQRGAYFNKGWESGLPACMGK